MRRPRRWGKLTHFTHSSDTRGAKLTSQSLSCRLRTASLNMDSTSPCQIFKWLAKSKLEACSWWSISSSSIWTVVSRLAKKPKWANSASPKSEAGKVYDSGPSSSSPTECFNSIPLRETANILQSFKPSCRPRPSKAADTGNNDFNLPVGFFLEEDDDALVAIVEWRPERGFDATFFFSFTVFTANDSVGVWQIWSLTRHIRIVMSSLPVTGVSLSNAFHSQHSNRPVWPPKLATKASLFSTSQTCEKYSFTNKYIEDNRIDEPS